MATVLAVYNSEGCVGRCDANCHNAKHIGCTCICGGKNHGAGLAKAIENNHEQFGSRPEDLQSFAQKHNLKCDELVVVDRVTTKDNRRARRIARARIAEQAPLPMDKLWHR